MDASSLLGGLLELLPVPLAGLAYAKRAQTLAKRGTPVPPARRLAFAAGLTLILIALFTPIARLADDLVYMHMVEHLLIGDLAALLLVLRPHRPDPPAHPQDPRPPLAAGDLGPVGGLSALGRRSRRLAPLRPV